MSEYATPKIADHLRRLARDVAYTEGHASVMRAAAAEIDRLAAHDREVAAGALRDAALDWQTRTWANTPRHADRIADRMAASQYACDWLRARADQIEDET